MSDLSSNRRLADLGAMLRMMKPLDGHSADPVLGKRRLLADLCRLVGTSVGKSTAGFDHGIALSPRLRQTLQCLLRGDSEKQAANELGLSRHTVHVYVKTLYKEFGVCSRGELMARCLGKLPPTRSSSAEANEAEESGFGVRVSGLGKN